MQWRNILGGGEHLPGGVHHGLRGRRDLRPAAGCFNQAQDVLFAIMSRLMTDIVDAMVPVVRDRSRTPTECMRETVRVHLERLFQITRKLVNGEDLSPAETFSWRERYCVDVRTRVLHGPEDYFPISPPYRLWMWPQDVQDAVGRLNLAPSRNLVHAN